MARSVIMLDSVEKGVYELPQSIAFYGDEAWDTLEGLVEPTQERGKLRLDGKTYMINVYVEHGIKIRYPYMLVEDLEKLR